MESSDDNAMSSPAPTSSARRSGRVSKVPDKFAPDAPAASKRKRDGDHDDEDAENESPDEGFADGDEEEPDESSDGDDAEPTGKSKKNKAKKTPSSSSRPKKPAAKKPKVNGDAPSAASHAAKLPSRPKKTVRLAVQRRDGDGLYAEIFGSGNSSDDVAAQWYQGYQQDNATAVTDLVNCILLSAGCDQQVTQDDIQDPENCQNRLADLQNVYAEEGITDYPLVSRAKTTRPFKDLLVGFFRSLVNVMHETDVLYKDDSLMENIARWVASMSSSTLRPFRHTATTVALAMEAALVEVAKKLDGRVTKTTQQLEAERKRKGKNKERVAAIQRELDEAGRNREVCQDQVRDFFETVFVHRYRDIDPRIRSECVEALGTWIWVLPTVFMEPEYLRYLGWMLSDVVPQTRHEVLKQLARIFKRDAGKLGHFIDRFRPRLVEMATKDSDVGTRVAAISVIETLKSTGMLEPDEVDAVAKLVFDSEPRVRKAVVDFFAGCVDDAIETKVEEMGGSDAIDELFGEDREDDFSTPRRDWISIKCLAEILSAYDAQFETEQPSEPPRPLDVAVDMFSELAPETRISLAAQALYEKIEQVRSWELLSGYLLYDHTTSSKSRSRSKSDSNEAALRDAVAPQGREESLLLQVLASAIKLSLSPGGSGGDAARKRPRADAAENQEETAVHLATTIPLLLKKFGAEPSTATVVLRLEHYLDLDIFQQLRQDATTYDRLLDEICTQFDRHVDRGVIAEAAAALLHARRFDEMEELVAEKVAVLWENALNSLRNLDRVCELSARGNLDARSVGELANVLMKMSKLAGIADPVDVLAADGLLTDSDSPAIDILARIVHRGKLEQVDEELDDLEDEAVSFAIKCCHFYLMWKTRSLVASVQQQQSGGDKSSSISGAEIDLLDALRKTYQTNLISTLSSRGTNDDLRLFATGALCDLHVLFASLGRVVAAQAPDGAQQRHAGLLVLVEEISPALVAAELIEIFDSAERAYARRAKKALNEPAHDEDPIDDDDQSDDDDDEESLSPDERRGRELKAEKSLCELASKYVMAILAKMLDVSGPQAGRLRRRMLRNQNKLGSNFKEVVAYLDEGKLREKMAASNGNANGSGKKRSHKAKGKQPADKKQSQKQKQRQQPQRQQPQRQTQALSDELIALEDDESDEDGAEVDDENPFEEGTEEDLRRRELLDQPDGDVAEDEEQQQEDRMDEDEPESVLGD